MISVIICSHNPREDYLRRVVDALRAQTLAKAQWELLLIDNLSDQPLESRFDLSWHSSGRIIREEELGLTSARLRGIRESTGSVAVFVDDDNVVSETFLANVAEIDRMFPFLGAWGGSIVGEFEVPPAEELRDFLPALAIRSIHQDRWSNYDSNSEPCGAGMCVRRAVLERYANEVQHSPIRKMLGRKGANLASAEDTDIARTSYDLALGTAVFTRLKVTHLIPGSRVQPEYLYRLTESISYSNTLLRLLRKSIELPTARGVALSWKRRLWSRLVEAVERRSAARLPISPINFWRKGEQRAFTEYRRLTNQTRTWTET